MAYIPSIVARSASSAESAARTGWGCQLTSTDKIRNATTRDVVRQFAAMRISPSFQAKDFIIEIGVCPTFYT
jgi:hypothetical protein